MISKEQIQICTSIARRYGAKKLVLFGSAAYDPLHARDIDLICEGVEGMDVFGMGAEMEEEAHASVDVVPVPPVSRFVLYNMSKGRVLLEEK